MEKKFYFLLIIAFLIIVIGGIFLWLEYTEEADEWSPGVEFESPENYVFKDTAEGKIVENLSAGISFKVPNNWTVDKEEIGIDEWIVNILSPDAEINQSGLLVSGCGVSASIQYHEATAMATRHRIEDPERFSNEISGGYQAIKIGEHLALRITIENPEWGKAVAIKIPIEDRIYMFETRFLPEEMERCSQVFEDFLKEISIE